MSLRFAHQVLSQPMACPKDFPLDIGALRECVRRAQIIVADNVAEYWFSKLSSEWDHRAGGVMVNSSDLPCCVPPFDNCFVEYQVPEVTCLRPELRRDTQKMQGVLYFSRDFSREKTLSQHLPEGSEDDATFAATPLAMTSDGRVAFIGAQFYLGFSPDGDLRWSFHAETAYGGTPGVYCLYPSLLAFSFMHCKNVSKANATKEYGPSPKWLKRQKQPELKYYTLDIQPMKEILRTEGQSEVTGLKKALHICRGHFANYTDDKRLFGKYTGRFFRPAHVRGKKEFGEVKKDYSVSVASN